ncbi:MAG TPA: hypothetical protein VEX60_00890 [Pyrinomonadaceae bacterium]|nr:hypothetical protein [Pyrinomonadaceae bacterium]
MKNFVNEGYGWACKRCGEEKTEQASSSEPSLARFFREGEAEEREPRLSTRALARWKDETQRTLQCPRCGVEENVSE